MKTINVSFTNKEFRVMTREKETYRLSWKEFIIFLYNRHRFNAKVIKGGNNDAKTM